MKHKRITIAVLVVAAMSTLIVGCKVKDYAVEVLRKSYTVVKEIDNANSLMKGVLADAKTYTELQTRISNDVIPYMERVNDSCDGLEKAMQYIAKVLGIDLVAEEPATTAGPIPKVKGVQRLGVANNNLEETLNAAQ